MYNQVSQIITLDGYQYAVMQGLYTRTYQRFFSVTAMASLVTTTYIDRGPGMNKYDISLQICTWSPDSLPYKNGVTQTWQEQLNNLETSYGKTAVALKFIDPFGNAPNTNGSNNGIYFIQYVQSVQDCVIF